jgi:hypothetical protein
MCGIYHIKFQFVMFQLKCGVGLFCLVPQTENTKLKFPFHSCFANCPKMKLPCH